MKVIGIDPGVTTGLAVWDALRFEFLSIEDGTICWAQQRLLILRDTTPIDLVIFEDARLRTIFTRADEAFNKHGAGIREGVGSIKRDCSIWEEWLGRYAFSFEARRPMNTKWDAAEFKRVTKWQSQTNEHKRDAGMAVFGLTVPKVRLKLIELDNGIAAQHNGKRPAVVGSRPGRAARRRNHAL